MDERQARLSALGPDDAAFDEQYTALVERAEQLLGFEQHLPARLAEPQRLRSAKIGRWSWRAQTGVAAALTINSGSAPCGSCAPIPDELGEPSRSARPSASR
ncbi:hypothetical protein [Streptomyces sp. NPDC051219]|uniref:hypothetical protein n=1 Tax=Streptomyces sp. NPDC051219 TaxID=3155283 RepID=UPI003442CFC9